MMKAIHFEDLIVKLEENHGEWLDESRIAVKINDDIDLIRCPILYQSINLPNDLSPLERLKNPPTHILLLIQAGSAAIAVVRGHEILSSKIERAYMVRKGQGTSQIKHLKSKGKSRLGSRIRLNESRRFFESINHYLKSWVEDFEVDRILYSCSELNRGYWFKEVGCPLEKNDRRWTKIPIHVHQPNEKELHRVIKQLQFGMIEV